MTVYTAGAGTTPPSWQALSAAGAVTTITGNSGGAQSPSSGNFNLAGGTTGLTFAGTANTETLTGTLVVANGGTGAATLTGLLLGNGTSAVTTVSYVGSTSWTPTLSFGGGTTGITYATQVGSYERVGSLVFFSLTIVLTNKGSSTGSMSIDGLSAGISPSMFTAVSLRIGLGLTFVGQLQAYISTGRSIALETIVSTSAATVLTDAAFANNTEIQIAGSYLV